MLVAAATRKASVHSQQYTASRTVQSRLVTFVSGLPQVKLLITPASSGKAPAEVTQIAVGRSDSHQIAVGHADGTVRIHLTHIHPYNTCPHSASKLSGQYTDCTHKAAFHVQGNSHQERCVQDTLCASVV